MRRVRPARRPVALAPVSDEPEPPPVLRRTPSAPRQPAVPRRPAPRQAPSAAPRQAPSAASRQAPRSAPRQPPAPRRSASRRPAPRRPTRRRVVSRLRHIGTWLLVAVLIAAAGTVSGAVRFDTALHRVPALAGQPDPPPAGRGTTWLLVGSDRRDDLTAAQQQRLATGGDAGPGRADTLLLVHLPAFGSGTTATVVSIPRDSYVSIPGHGMDKINAAYPLGGSALTARTVEQATGLRLDHYAELGFGGLAAVVDALGGISICLDEPIADPLAGVDLPAGCRRLDGAAALGYVRSRATPRADLDRMVHQRLFLAALLRSIAGPAVWLNPWRWYAVPHAIAGALAVDRAAHVWDLAGLAWALRGSTTRLTVPIGELTDTAAGEVVVWDHRAAERLFAALAADAPVPPALLE
ncbi:MAG TPA: LCP family protein [Mycobacterium sp.]|nr:LCP family protein [Mycobacterium sp.]